MRLLFRTVPKGVVWLVVLLAACPFLPASGWAQEDATSNWPREIDTPEGLVVIYQPQPEKLDGNQLKGRAAVALELNGSEEPVFGAVWFSARLDTDRAAEWW